MRRHPRTRSNTIGLGLALLGLTALTGCTGSAPPATPKATQAAQSATAMLDESVGALLSAGTVHIRFNQYIRGEAYTTSTDVTPTSGREVITYNKTEHATIMFIGGAAYVWADEQALESVFGVPAVQAAVFWGEWIVVKSGEKLGTTTYAELVNGMTLSAMASELLLCGTCTLTAPVTVAGQREVGVWVPVTITGQKKVPASAREVLYVTDSPQPRPVLLELEDDGDEGWNMSFSGFREAVRLTAPKYATSAFIVTPNNTAT
jgi:hypothetical protein